MEGVGAIGGGAARGEVDGTEEGDEEVWRMKLEPKKESVALRWEREHERVEKKSEMETWLVMRLVRILKPEREPRWLTLQRIERVRVSEKCGWVGFSNFYFYSLISLIEIYLV